MLTEASTEEAARLGVIALPSHIPSADGNDAGGAAPNPTRGAFKKRKHMTVSDASDAQGGAAEAHAGD